MELNIILLSLKFSANARRLDIWQVDLSSLVERSCGRFIDTFKKSLRKAKYLEAGEMVLQELVSVYRKTSNANVTAKISHAEVIFARKIRPTFNQLLSGYKMKSRQFETIRWFKIGDNVFFRSFQVLKEKLTEGRNYSTPL